MNYRVGDRFIIRRYPNEIWTITQAYNNDNPLKKRYGFYAKCNRTSSYFTLIFVQAECIFLTKPKEPDLDRWKEFLV